MQKQALLSRRNFDIFTALCLAAGFAVLMIRIKNIGATMDESFYLTIPLRLINGDGLISDEWHLSQLFSIVLYLPVRLFTLTTGGVEGIILFMRTIFSVFITFCSAAVYITFREKGLSAVAAAVFLMFFAPINIRTSSYYTLGTAFLMLCLCLLYSQREGFSPFKTALAGFTLALTVLCNPVSVLLFLYYICALIFAGLKNFFTDGAKKSRKGKSFTEKSKIKELLSKRAFVFFCCGILPLFIYFCILLFKNSSFIEILRTLPMLFTDPEHISTGETMAASPYAFMSFFTDLPNSAGILPLAAALLLTLTIAADKKRLPHRKIYLYALTAVFTVYALVFFIRLIAVMDDKVDNLYYFYVPVTLAGLAAYMLCKNKNRLVFYLFLIPGLLFAFSMAISSNLGLYTQVCGYIISAIGSLFIIQELIAEFFDENKPSEEKKQALILRICASVLAFLIVFQCGALIVDSLLNVYLYYPNRALVEDGIFKGIKIPLSEKRCIDAIRQDIEAISEAEAERGRLFICDNFPFGYIESSMKIGAFSAWFIGSQLWSPPSQQRFFNYYSMNPDNIPDYIYIPDYVYSGIEITLTDRRYMLELLDTMFEGEKSRLENGYLIKVSAVKMP